MQSDRFLGWPLGLKNVLKPLANSVFMLLGLTAANSAADIGSYKRFYWKFVRTEIKLHIQAVTLSTQDNQKRRQLEYISIKSIKSIPNLIFELFNCFQEFSRNR